MCAQKLGLRARNTGQYTSALSHSIFSHILHICGACKTWRLAPPLTQQQHTTPSDNRRYMWRHTHTHTNCFVMCDICAWKINYRVPAIEHEPNCTITVRRELSTHIGYILHMRFYVGENVCVVTCVSCFLDYAAWLWHICRGGHVGVRVARAQLNNFILKFAPENIFA